MLTDILLIKKIKQEDDQKSFIELVNRHTGIYNTIAYSYTRTGDKSLYHDIIDDREYNFYSFVKDFDENKKMKFSTYVGERTKFLCLDKNRTHKRYSFEEINDNLEYQGQSIDIEIYGENMVKKLKDAVSKIENSRFKKIMEMRFFSSLNLMKFSDIAKNIGVTIQYVNKVYNDNIEQFMKDFKDNNI